jgi:hypothetical protein
VTFLIFPQQNIETISEHRTLEKVISSDRLEHGEFTAEAKATVYA